MTQGNPFGGKDLRVMRKASATDNAPTFMCTVTTKGLTETVEFDDASIPDCDNPSALWARRSVAKGYAWSVNISGMADASSYKTMRADMKSGLPVFVQILVAKPLAQGGGRWDGAVLYENLQISSDSGGVVKFSGQMRGEGDLVWTDASA